MKIDKESWARLSALLDAALDLDEAARAAWLAELSPADAGLRPALERLLSREADERFADATLGPFVPRAVTDAQAGQVVAGYRLIRLLGQGGMGAVWLAERTEATFRRPVALKLLHPSLAGTAFVERFRRERDILARLDHPGIARLYDAGESPSGPPYLALEYVEGAPIDKHCDGLRLPLEARVRLFQRVLAAIQYAHGQLVVHRDIKPSNVIVTPMGEPRLLDFGIAKLLEDASGMSSELTRIGQRLLTPEYASPEQITGAPVGIASDVYSLGVVLYELLAGRRPYRVKRGSLGSLEDAVLAGDFPRASEAAASDDAAARRGVTLPRLRRALRGDLDAILAKALRTDPAQRYPTCESFGDDLARCLRGEAVLARHGDRSYAVAKFVRRHWLPLGVSAAIAGAIGIGGGVALWQADVARANAARALAEAARAERERAVAVATKEFLVGVFRSNDPDAEGYVVAGERTAREVLADGVARLRMAFDDQPQTKAELYDAIVDILVNIDEPSTAFALAQENVAFTATQLGRQHEQHVAALLRKAIVLADLNRLDEGRRAVEQAAAILDARGDRDSALRGRQLVLGGARFARPGAEGALDLERAKQGVALLAAHGASASMRAQALVEIGNALLVRGQGKEALSTLDAALEWAQGFPGAELVRSRAFGVRSSAQAAAGNVAEAETSARAAVDALQSLPPGHPELVRCMLALGNFLHAYGHRHEGRTWLALALERAQAAFARGSMAAANAWMSYLRAAIRDGAGDRVHAAMRPVQAILSDAREPAPTRVQAGLLIARWHLDNGESRKAARVVAAIDPLAAAADPPLAARVNLLRARLALIDGKAADAQEWIDRVDALESRTPTSSSASARPVVLDLSMRSECLLIESEIAYRQGRLQEATQRAEAAARVDTTGEPYAEEDVAAAAMRVGTVRLAAGDAAGAEEALQKALAIYAREHDPRSPLLAKGRALLERAGASKAGAPAKVAHGGTR